MKPPFFFGIVCARVLFVSIVLILGASSIPPQKVFGPTWHPPQSHLLRKARLEPSPGYVILSSCAFLSSPSREEKKAKKGEVEALPARRNPMLFASHLPPGLDRQATQETEIVDAVSVRVVKVANEGGEGEGDYPRDGRT